MNKRNTPNRTIVDASKMSLSSISAYVIKSATTTTAKFTSASPIVIISLVLCFLMPVQCMTWDRSVDLNDDFRLLWTIEKQEVTFEVQVRTLGYVGLGFSRDGQVSGADVAVGWVDRGQAYFQDRHVKRSGDIEPVVDPSQDYVLTLGYENATHTVLRFKRKLDTCDTAHDIPITNDTMRIIFMYHEDEPRHGSVIPGSLPSPAEAYREYRPLFLTEKFRTVKPFREEHERLLQFRNEDVELPRGDDSLFWCKMFKIEDINQKHHVVRYEAAMDSPSSLQHLQHIILYECQGNAPELEQMSRELGRECDKPLECNAIVAAWARGSQGFVYPDEVGYPLDSRQAKYYLMETLYSNPNPDFTKLHARPMVDNSGLNIYFTHLVRKNDAGVLSIGVDPNWRHIIPPGQKRVITEGQCIEDCTGYAFPAQGINIFAVMMQTRMIGKEVKLRQIRRNEELPPIAHDSNIDPNYQEYRRLPEEVRSLPGDRLIAECIYDSSSRKTITLGGLKTRDESCIVLTLYYPRQKELTTCHSLPSLPTVLHSLGIENLATGSNPLLISSPPELAGMTFESRLLSYDWENQFNKFQQVTRRGSFNPLCSGAKNRRIPGTEYLEGYSPNITKIWKQPRRCKPKRLFATETSFEIPVIVQEDDASNNIIEGAARSKVSRSSATETMGYSSGRRLYSSSIWRMVTTTPTTLSTTVATTTTELLLHRSLWYTIAVVLLPRILRIS